MKLRWNRFDLTTVLKLEIVPLSIFVKSYLIKHQSCYHRETSQLTCSANQLTGFYMMATLAFNELVMLQKLNVKITKMLL